MRSANDFSENQRNRETENLRERKRENEKNRVNKQTNKRIEKKEWKKKTKNKFAKRARNKSVHGGMCIRTERNGPLSANVWVLVVCLFVVVFFFVCALLLRIKLMAVRRRTRAHARTAPIINDDDGWYTKQQQVNVPPFTVAYI